MERKHHKDRKARQRIRLLEEELDFREFPMA